MECANPVLRINLGKKTLFRHWNLASYLHKAIGIPRNCNTCIHCRKKNSLELARRCVLHASMYQDNCFITLTYNESSVGDNTLNYSDIQKFKKRLRRSIAPKRIEIFNVHEYGSFGRKHWHLVIFNHDFNDKQIFSTSSGIPIYTSEQLAKLWRDPKTKLSYGHHTIGNVTEASAMYQAQYTQKDIINGNTNNAKKAKSNHSGIGRPYFLRHYKQLLTLGYVPFDGQRMPLPKYFQRLAHKHYCHFYDQSAFFDNKERKAIHRPFKAGQENKEIADLFVTYKKNQEPFMEEHIQKWKETLEKHTRTKRSPDFVKSGENTLHDMRTKKLVTKEKF